MKDFALIKNGIVERVIFGDLNFIKAAGLDQNYDACVDLRNLILDRATVGRMTAKTSRRRSSKSPRPKNLKV